MSQVSCSKHWTFLPAERSLSPPSEGVRQEDSLQSLCIFLHYLQQHSLRRKLSFHKRHETVKVTATSCMHDYTENSYMLSGSAFISNLCGFLCSGLPIFSHLGRLQCSRVPGFTFIFYVPGVTFCTKRENNVKIQKKLLILKMFQAAFICYERYLNILWFLFFPLFCSSDL